jgi:hypothetical protein
MSARETSRRKFLKQTGLAAGLASAGLLADKGLVAAAEVSGELGAFEGAETKVAIVADLVGLTTTTLFGVSGWAISQLRSALETRGVSVRVCGGMNDVHADERCVVAALAAASSSRATLDNAGVTVPSDLEALAIVPGKAGERAVLLACGRGMKGLTYALLELADRVTHAENPLAALEFDRPVVEQPANPIRSVARLFASDVEDKTWFHDRAFWPPYLTMLAAQRFNRFALTLGLGYDFTRQIRDAYLHFAYPFLVSVPGYKVRAVDLPDEERTKNLDMLRFISDEAAQRGLHFQLGLWTHAYQWTNSPDANYTIEGLNADNHAGYCRDALRTLLQACPSISGVTFRIHGESGVAEGSYGFWKTVFEGVAQCGRKVEIDLHAKGIDDATINVAVATGMHVNISQKYWAEHMGLPYHQASIRALELPPPDRKDTGFFSRSDGSRRFLRYGYGDLLTQDRPYGVFFRMWPGTQRLLLWGDPAMAAAYGRASSFCGSLGAEIMEPLSFKGRKGSGLTGGRTAYQDRALRPDVDWEKYQYTYRLWGRLLYNPDTDPDGWRRSLREPFGAGAEASEKALAHASRILPLVTTAHLPSAANNNYWPENYTNMSIVDAAAPNPYGDSPSPRRFGTVSPLDPTMFSRVDDFAEELLAGRPSGKYSPLEVASWLQGLAETAVEHLAEAEKRVLDKNAPEFRRLAVDVGIQSGLGRFYAAKLRAGVLYALSNRGRETLALEEALKAYQTARAAWAELAKLGDGVYARDITFGPEAFQRGHWLDRLPAIDLDIEKMKKLLSENASPGAGPPAVDADRVKAAVRAALASPRRPSLACQHKPPASFRPGDPVAIELAIGNEDTPARPVSVRLRYRRVNQAEAYRVEEMHAQEGRWGAIIPEAYTQSRYALQYFFELHDRAGQAWLHPGFAPDLCNQPYFVIRQG